MTKEECLNKYDTSHKYIEQTCRPELFAAMDEYANSKSVEFLKWKDLNFEGNYRIGYWQSEHGIVYTISELYQLFLKLSH